MRDIIATIGSLVVIIGMVPYIRDTIKGKTKPNLVSWFTWTLLTSIGAAAAISQGATTTAILSIASALSTLSVVILGLKKGVFKFTIFDVVCQVAALLGVVLWRITSLPELAIAIVVLTDMTAALPTYRHAWQRPHEETWQAYVCGGIGSGLVLVTVTQLSFVALAYPVWLTASNLLLVAVIFYRSRVLKLKVVK